MKKAAGLCAQGAENIIKDTITRAAGNEQNDSGDNPGSLTGDGRKNYAVPLILIARRRDRLEALRRELGTECLLLPADLARREDLIRLCEDLVGRRIDVFINNAGFGVSGPFMASEVSREVGMIDVNVTAQHVLFKYILHRMEAEGGGSILNVASSAGLFPAGPYMSGYYATKAYMTSLTRGVAEELRQAKSPVYVGCLCPGPVNTEFNDVADVSFALPGISPEECVDYALRMMARRQTVIIPGRQIRAAVIGQRLLPTALTVRITAAQQKKKMSAPEQKPAAGAFRFE